MSRAQEIAAQDSVILLRDKLSVLSLKPYLACDLFVIGGQQVYRTFLDEMDKWIVTQIPLEVLDADTFMPENFLQGFKPCDSAQLENNLKVIIYERG
jgi:dihydrofolate reductase